MLKQDTATQRNRNIHSGHDKVIFNAIFGYGVGLAVEVEGWDIEIGTVEGKLYAYDKGTDSEHTVSSGMPKAAAEFLDCKTK